MTADDGEDDDPDPLDSMVEAWLSCPGCDYDGSPTIIYDGEHVELECGNCRMALKVHGWNLSGFPDP